jgi:sec-independent protein translocase protein TatC
VIVGAFVIGAIFTPPDVISQSMLAIPLWLLYEAGVLVAAMMSKSRPKDDADYQPMSSDELDGELDRIESKENTN